MLSPPFIAPRRIDDPVGALAQVRTVYDSAVDHLRTAIGQFIGGEDLTQRVRAYYPYVRQRVDTLARADSRLSYGFVAGPGTYETTLTRPDLFAAYYLEEFEKVLNIATTAEVDAQGRLLVAHLVDGAPMTFSYLLSWLNEELERIREAGFAVMVTAWTRFDDSFRDDTPTEATSLRLVPFAELLPLAAQDADG